VTLSYEQPKGKEGTPAMKSLSTQFWVIVGAIGTVAAAVAAAITLDLTSVIAHLAGTP
jgi:hypothetical protein